MAPIFVGGSRPPAVHTHARFPRLTPLALVLGALLPLSPAFAQTIQLTGTQGAYANNQTGQAGAEGQGDDTHPQDGSAAPGGPALSVELVNGATMTSVGATPTLNLSLTGGAGGKGTAVKGGNYGPFGGNGGQGGTPGELQFTGDLNTTITSDTTGPAAVVLQSTGGAGGYGGSYTGTNGDPGKAGAAGEGGEVTANLSGSIISTHGWSGTTPGTTALLMSSTGGAGGGFDPAYGSSGTAQHSVGDTTANAGAAGGAGGTVTLTTQDASFVSQGTAIELLSQGGQGSDGVAAYSPGTARGGNGGTGGAGGTVNGTITGEANSNSWLISAIGSPQAAQGNTINLPHNDGTVETSFLSAGASAQSFGGSGGMGGYANGTPAYAGTGGKAGDGGAVTLTLGDINVTTKGYTTPALLAQSIGGSGGDGADAGSVFKAKAGNGADGGNGGNVVVQTYSTAASGDAQATISTNGDDSSGIVAQSIGGGGGAGGDAMANGVLAGMSVGGNGEQGGLGGTVTVVNGQTATGKPMPGAVILTTGDRSDGISAMSIGGGGGSGGNASTTTAGAFTMTVGGTGGKGGDAGTPGTQQVSVLNNGIIQTNGAHSIGVQAMAVGGGGGNGGSASSIEGGAQLDVTLAVGGAGGSAGNAGDVYSTNNGQILTQGTDAFGMQVLSVGGGGGNGGASKAAAYQLLNTGEAPSLDFNLSIGGQGGGGGDGGNVFGTNNASIVTSGAGSHGLEVQSIGGGGGNGGDSSSTQTSTKGSNINVNLAIGGDGKGGGSGGQVTATNKGLIWTMAGDSDAVFAQSVGGGGGNGGTGYADTSQFADNDGKGGQLQLAIGGGGGTGDTGGTVTATNGAGATIITMGDSARGIFAQSIGGSGGNGGGGQSNGSSGTLDARVAVGGTGGNGNTGGTVTANNAGTIVTGGGDSAGIYAESVGGGGGDGGKAATGGGNDPQTQLFNYLQTSLPSVVQTYSNKTDGFIPNAASLFDRGVNWTVKLVKGYYQDNASNGATPPASGAGDGDLSVTLTVGGGFAGKGGSGDTGGDVTVNNLGTGAIQTLGPMSDGIFALSVGGGGGDGGAVAATNNTNRDTSKLNVSIAVGGRGGTAGDGGTVSVINNGSIATAGSDSLGIFAGSFGGGGGTGGVTATSVLNGSNTLQTVNVELGGDAGATGDGHDVTVNSFPAAQQSTQTLVSTTGSYAAGIGAMSVGGGGGLVTLNGTAPDPTTGGAVSTGGLQMTGFQIAGKDQAVVCGGQSLATCGNGGNVLVVAQNVQTTGQDAAGIVAQSVGGGGGWIQGAASNAQNYFSGSNVNGTSGDGQDANVKVLNSIATSGNGAYGVIAQSIGGGGLLGGDFSSAVGSAAFTPEDINQTKGSIGNGGNVTINVPTNASVTTSGNNAIGIFAQSVGGGGGLVASENTAYMGTAGGTGASGIITVDVDGKVATSGQNATAIFVNADGSTASSNAAAVNVTGQVTATGAGASAIVFNSNAITNTVTNSGLIGYRGVFGSAIVAERGNVDVTNQAAGTINGRISLGSGGTLQNSGTWILPTGTISLAGYVDNMGTGSMVVGQGLTSGGSVPNTFLDGYLVLNGTLATYVDFASKQDSLLTIEKGASLVGTIQINPVTMAPNTVAVLSVPTSLGTGNYKVVDGSNYLYQYTPKLSDGVLSVTPQAKLASAAQDAGLSRNAQQLANHLQSNFDAGVTSLSPLYTTLAQVKDPAQYAATLNGLGAESLQMVGVARINASESFVNRMNACPNNGDTPAELREHDCVWGRVTDQVSNADSGDGDAYHLNEHVVQMGGQHEFADGWWAGGSVAYNNGNESAASGVGGVTDHGVSVGGVVKRELGNWTFTGALDASQGSYQSARNLQLVDERVQATGSFDGTNIGLHSRISYLFSDSSWYVRPYIDLHMVNVHTDSFQESNAGAIGLKVAAGNGTVFAATPMIEAGDRFTYDSGVQLRPSIGVGRAFYSGNSWNTDMRLAGAPDSVGSFNSAFNAPRQMNQYDAALDLKLNAHSELRLDYTGQFGNGYRMNEGALKYTYFF